MAQQAPEPIPTSRVQLRHDVGKKRRSMFVRFVPTDSIPFGTPRYPQRQDMGLAGLPFQHSPRIDRTLRPR